MSEREVQTDFECVSDGCKNRVSVYSDWDKCINCRKNEAEIPENKEVWEYPHTA